MTAETMEAARQEAFEGRVAEQEARFQCMALVKDNPAMGFQFAVALPGFSWVDALAVLSEPDACPEKLKASLGAA